MKSRIKILPDGREICKGYQWAKRVRELKARANGYCEAGSHIHIELMPGVWLTFAPLIECHPRHFIGDQGDPHHRIKRSIERDDRLRNLLWICRSAHLRIHDNYRRRVLGRDGSQP